MGKVSFYKLFRKKDFCDFIYKKSISIKYIRLIFKNIEIQPNFINNKKLLLGKWNILQHDVISFLAITY